MTKHTDEELNTAQAAVERLANDPDAPGYVHEAAIVIAAELKRQAERIKELEGLINKPEISDFLLGVQIEAAHQVERWGAEHDTGKEPQEWFWLIGYLSGKALAAALSGDLDKAKHHTISTSAALANWHALLSGHPTAMRPGVDAAARGFDTIATPPAAPSLPADVVALAMDDTGRAEVTTGDAFYAAWGAIKRDPRLRSTLEKLSVADIHGVMKHVAAALAPFADRVAGEEEQADA